MDDQEKRRSKRSINQPTDARAAKRAKSSSSEEGSSQAPQIRAGKIEKIHVKNFFCHDSLEVTLNPSVNFIIGKNGSGKSAILAALTVGLGARASVTRRGDNYKKMIKSGKLSASIEIALCNKGVGAYKPEKYGDSIKVIRTINQTTTHYHIKNALGQVISTKKADLDQIVSFLKIQVENPISVLNQDTAKDFLLAATPQKKYELFMKATQLEVIGENYKEALAISLESEQKLSVTNEQMDKEKEQMQILEENIQRLDSLNDDQQKLDELKVELKWANAIKEESKLKAAQKDFDNASDHVNKLKNEAEGKGTRGDEITNLVAKETEKIKEIEVEIDACNKEHTSTKSEYDNKRTELIGKSRELRSCHAKIQRDKKNIQALSDAIKGIEEGTDKAAEEQNANKEQLTKMEEELSSIEASLNSNKVSQMHMENHKRELMEKDMNKKRAYESANQQVMELKAQIRGLDQQKGNSLSIFGKNMPRLMKRIEEENKKGRFKRKPIGPVGAFINMRDSDWTPAVERLLGFGVFSTILVDNSNDLKTVMKLMEEIYGSDHPPSIYNSKFIDRVHDVSQQCAKSTKYQILLDAMEIKDPNVTNYLIDSSHVETILLIPTSRECTEVLDKEENVPLNCKRAITLHGDQFFPQPNYRSYGSRVGPKKYLEVSTTEKIQNLRTDIAAAEETKEIAINDLNDHRKKIAEAEREYNIVSGTISKLRSMQVKMKNDIETLKDSINDQVDPNENLELWKEEIVQLKEKIAQATENEKQLQEQERCLESEVEELKSKIKVHQKTLETLENKIIPIRNKIHKLQEEKNQLEVHTKHASRRVQAAHLDLQKKEAQLESQKRVTEKAVGEAEKSSQRIVTKRSSAEIKNLVDNLQIQIATVRRELGNRESLVEQLNVFKSKHGKTIEFLHYLTKTNKKHVARVRDRERQYKKMKKEMGRTIAEAFTAILQLRGYEGSITIDHRNKKLDIDICPQNTEKRKVNGPKTLSGGERSYSTVAFILALWECTAVPFYFMDEFDVYMDKVNRRMVMDCLLDHAKRHPQCQFGFLTPLDASNVQKSDTLSIHRLANPERGPTDQQ